MPASSSSLAAGSARNCSDSPVNQPRQCGAVANRSVRHVKGPSNVALEDEDTADNGDDNASADAAAEEEDEAAKASGSGLSCGGIETRADARLRTVFER